MAKEMAIKLDEKTRQRLSFIGETASMPERQLAEDAVRAYSKETERQIKAVQQGQEDIRNGKTNKLVYQLNDGTVEILRVIHQAQDWP